MSFGTGLQAVEPTARGSGRTTKAVVQENLHRAGKMWLVIFACLNFVSHCSLEYFCSFLFSMQGSGFSTNSILLLNHYICTGNFTIRSMDALG